MQDGCTPEARSRLGILVSHTYYSVEFFFSQLPNEELMKRKTKKMCLLLFTIKWKKWVPHPELRFFLGRERCWHYYCRLHTVDYLIMHSEAHHQYNFLVLHVGTCASRKKEKKSKAEQIGVQDFLKSYRSREIEKCWKAQKAPKRLDNWRAGTDQISE